MTSEIQWYIARDGKQYGPLSDAEMGLFVRGGHLKPDDLVWRPGFSDWTAASSVYPSTAATAPQAPAPAPSHQSPTQPQAYHPAPTGGPHGGTAQGAASPARANASSPVQTSANSAMQPGGQQGGWPNPQTASHAPAQQAHRPDTQAPIPRHQASPAQGSPFQGQPAQTSAPQPMGGARQPQHAGTQHGGAHHPQHGQQPSPGLASPQTSRTGPGSGYAGNTAGGPASGDARTAPGRSIVAMERGLDGDDDIDEPGGRSRFGRFALAALILLLIGGGGWFGYQNRDSIKTMAGQLMSGAMSRTGDPSIPAFVVEGDTPAAIDARLQKTALWSVVKREFPDWYGERLAETARLASEKKPDAAITQHLLEALAALRRKHSEAALSASSPRLLSIADAFLTNLKRIGTLNTTTCYSFISQGESSPAVVDLVNNGGSGTGLQTQVTAVFEAIAEGRKSPVKHMNPDKTDYDALAEQLTKLGWSQADLQLFADPRALARTSHERVCKMVQDWFTAHISITDRAAQERLLIETLRPVVAS